jgi:hypothetical protein
MWPNGGSELRVMVERSMLREADVMGMSGAMGFDFRLPVLQ